MNTMITVMNLIEWNMVIIVKLELVFGFDERGFGLGNPSSDPVVEFIDGLVGGTCTIWLETHLREPAGVCHEGNLPR
jgi:hypothetical protein